MMEGNWMVQALITFNWQLLDKISEMNEIFISLADICGICYLDDYVLLEYVIHQSDI